MIVNCILSSIISLLARCGHFAPWELSRTSNVGPPRIGSEWAPCIVRAPWVPFFLIECAGVLGDFVLWPDFVLGRTTCFAWTASIRHGSMQLLWSPCREWVWTGAHASGK